MPKTIIVLVEHHEGEIRKASLQAVGVAESLAAKTSAECVALVVGGGSTSIAAKLGAFGISKADVLDDAALDKYLGERWASAVGGALSTRSEFLLLLGASAVGRDLAPRLAQRLGAGHLGDVTGVAVEGGAIRFTRPIFAGKASETVELATASGVVTLRPNSFPLPPQGAAAVVATTAAPAAPSGDLRSTVAEVVRRSGLDTVELTEADIIVSGGIGVGGPEGYAPLKELCKVLGAALGASRAAVHAGWIGADHQVGQTGKTVSPSLYIACGISGQIQHQAGMRTSKCIVAINTDPAAPIFQIAHYGIVGDVKVIVPMLTEEFRKVLGR